MHLFLVTLVVFSMLSSLAPAQPILIKFSHVTANNTPKGRGAHLFKQLVEERLAGRVSVEVYPNSQLFGDREEMRALLRNDVQLIAPSLAKFKQFTGRLQVFDLPFLFDDMEAVERFQKSRHGQQLLTELGRYGYLGLAYWHNGLKQISAPHPLRVPQDAAGLKFRVMTSDVLVAQFQAVGSNPQKMAFAEVYQALQTGTVDGQENTWSNIYAKKFYEVQPFITHSNHGLLDYMLLTNARFWRRLPADIRQILEEIILDVTNQVNEISASLNEEARQNIIKSGQSTIITLTDAERQQWKDAMKIVWRQFESQIGKELIETAASLNFTQGATQPPMKEDDSMHASMTEQQDSMHASMTEQQDSMHASMTEQQDSMHASMTEQQDSMHASMTEQQDSMHASMTEQQDSMHASMTEQQDSMHASMTEQQDSMHASMTEQQDSMHASMTEQQDSMHASMTEQQDSMHASMTEQQDSMHASMTEQQDSTPASMTEQQDSTPASMTEQQDSTPASMMKESKNKMMDQTINQMIPPKNGFSLSSDGGIVLNFYLRGGTYNVYFYIK